MSLAFIFHFLVVLINQVLIRSIPNLNLNIFEIHSISILVLQPIINIVVNVYLQFIHPNLNPSLHIWLALIIKQCLHHSKLLYTFFKIYYFLLKLSSLATVLAILLNRLCKPDEILNSFIIQITTDILGMDFNIWLLIFQLVIRSSVKWLQCLILVQYFFIDLVYFDVKVVLKLQINIHSQYFRFLRPHGLFYLVKFKKLVVILFEFVNQLNYRVQNYVAPVLNVLWENKLKQYFVYSLIQHIYHFLKSLLLINFIIFQHFLYFHKLYFIQVQELAILSIIKWLQLL